MFSNEINHLLYHLLNFYRANLIYDIELFRTIIKASTHFTIFFYKLEEYNDIILKVNEPSILATDFSKHV